VGAQGVAQGGPVGVHRGQGHAEHQPHARGERGAEPEAVEDVASELREPW
jgi:hypothetical protein